MLCHKCDQATFWSFVFGLGNDSNLHINPLETLLLDFCGLIYVFNNTLLTYDACK